MGDRSRSHWPISVLASVSALINMFLPLVLVRVLPPADVGKFKIFFLYLMVVPSLALSSGLLSGLAYWAGQGARARAAMQLSGALLLLLALLVGGALAAMHPVLARAMGWEGDQALWFALAAFGAVATLYFDEATIATGRIWTGAFFHSGFEMLRTAAMLGAALVYRSLNAVFVAHAAVILCKAALGFAAAVRLDLLGREFLRKEHSRVLNDVFRYAMPVSVALVFGVFTSWADQLILSTYLSASAFAVYSIGCLSVPPLLILEQSVMRVLIPQLSSAFAQGHTRRAAELYQGAVRQLSFLLVPAVTGLFVFADPIIELLFTKQYAASAGYLRVFAFSYLLLCIPPDAVQRSRGQSGWILKNSLIFSSLAVVLCFLLARAHGALGALAGMLFAKVLMKARSVIWVKHDTGWGWSEFLPLRAMLDQAVACAVLGALAWGTRAWFSTPLQWFCVAGAGFSVFYFLISLAVLRPMNAARAARGKGRVLMLTQYLGIGGLEKMILNLSVALKKSGRWEPSVFVYDHQPDSKYENLIASFRARQVDVETFQKPPGYSPRAVFRIAQAVVRGDITVIHTHDLGALIYGVLAKIVLCGGVRLVHTQHSFVHLRKAGRYAWYERIFARLADRLTVVSDATRDEYARLGIPAKKIEIVANGVDFPDLPLASRQEKIALRQGVLSGHSGALQRGSLPLDAFWILVLGRLHPVKGQRQAIEIWGKIPAELRKKSVLWIVGPEAERGEIEVLERLRASVPDSDRILLMGGTQDPRAWILASDVFLSASEFEGMPLGPIEARGSGVPCVLSDIPGHSFLKEQARFFALKDADAGAQALEEALRLLPGHGSNDSSYYSTLWSSSGSLRARYSADAMAEVYARAYKG